MIGQLELDINALQRQIEEFKKHPENITSLEWEIFVQRLDLMHQYCSKLKTNVRPEEKQMEQRQEIIVPVVKPVLPEIKEPAAIINERKKERKEEIVNNIEHTGIKEETVITDQHVESRSYQESGVNTTVETKTTTQKAKKQIVSVGGLFGDTLSHADKFKDEPSIADTIAQTKSEKSVAHKMQHKPIKDLKDAIGINEKFLFINELFDGNLQDYSEALNKLNAFQNLQSAEEFITEIASRYSWADDSEHVKEFRDLVERRFFS